MQRVIQYTVSEVDMSSIEPLFFRVRTISKTQIVGVLADPSIITSPSYTKLKNRWTSGLSIIEPDCREWDALIDSNRPQHIDLEVAVRSMTRWHADVIVIAHASFESLRNQIESIAGPMVRIIDSRDYA